MEVEENWNKIKIASVILFFIIFIPLFYYLRELYMLKILIT